MTNEGPGPDPWSGALLVIDDETPVREVLCALLADRGFTVFGAANGRDALVACERHAGELRGVLLDLTMPGSTTDDLVASLRAIAPRVPLILTSGRATSDIEETVARLHCAGFIRKPFGAEELFHAVRSLLDAIP